MFKLALLSFIVWALCAALKSQSPFTQNLYGVYGRNTGLLAYLFLGILALVSSRLMTVIDVNRVLLAFYVSLGVNLIYCLWVISFGDFVGWQNTYGAILGTFGNPNFISAFLGMSLGPQISYFIKSGYRGRAVLALSIALTGFELLRADSLQGIVISCVGIWLVLTYWISKKYNSRIFVLLSLALGMISSIFSLFGALGIGPLKGVMAQPTVALREQYWYAGIQMGLKNPIFGVGMDSYGDWYRRTRGSQSLITPGAETVTNAAHNVFIDIFSYGGVPLFAAYLVLVVIGFVVAGKMIYQRDKFDPIKISLLTIFIGYQIQSIISINQIGLAVWGWVSLGLLVSMDRIEGKHHGEHIKASNQKKKAQPVISPGLVGALGAMLGIFLASPPLTADMKWVSALRTKQLTTFEDALDGSYFSPRNSYRLAQGVETLENSNLPELAIKYARAGVKYNPQSFNSWQMLYYATNATNEERNRAKAKLISLDPLNQKWRSLK